MIRPALFLLACLAAAICPLASRPPRPVPAAEFPGWPTQFEGRPLQPQPLSARETAYLEGAIRVGRFSDGAREIILRWIPAPTRKLHPAHECLRATGWRIRPQPLQVRDGLAWSAFVAEGRGPRMAVRERIWDDAGGSWPDASGWFWAAVRGQTRGPWWAASVAARPGEE